MYFVDDEYFVAIPRGRDLNRADDYFTDVVDAGVRCRVDLMYVERGRGRDFETRVALAAGLGSDPLNTVERFCQYASGRCLADSAGSCEQISVVKTLGLDRIFESASDRILADYLVEGLRPELPGYNLRIRH